LYIDYLGSIKIYAELRKFQNLKSAKNTQIPGTSLNFGRFIFLERPKPTLILLEACLPGNKALA
jgi:hypothetical protein